MTMAGRRLMHPPDPGRKIRTYAESGSTVKSRFCLDVAKAAWLQVEYAICLWWVLRLQQRQRHVVHRNSTRGLAVEHAVMRVSVQHHVGGVTVHHFPQARAASIGKNLHRLAAHGYLYR